MTKILTDAEAIALAEARMARIHERMAKAAEIEIAQPRITIDTTAPARPWLTTSEVAERLGVKANTVGDWIRTGKLRARPVSGYGADHGYRITRADLDAFADTWDGIESPDAALYGPDDPTLPPLPPADDTYERMLPPRIRRRIIQLRRDRGQLQAKGGMTHAT